MFDIVNKHKRAVQVLLALITLPFAFFGIDYYFRGSDNVPEVARVGKTKITQQEFADALREEQDRLRGQMGANYDPTLLDTPETRFALLERMIGQKLLEDRARQRSVVVSDGQLQQVIASIEAFQENGRFSPDKYRQFLAARNMSALQFEQRFRRELQLAPVSDPVAAGTFVSRSAQERFLNLYEQQREVASATLPASAYAKDAKVDDAAIKAFYDANPTRFRTPERARFEYVMLTPQAVAGSVTIEPDELTKYYEGNKAQFGAAEERAASHILIAVKPDAKPEEKEAAKKKSEEILARVKANPAQFAEIAKKESQDPGSAAQGGSLGQFPRGTMVKPFEEAVFSLKVGDIAGPVASDFGYHIIKLDGIVPATIKPFEQVRAQIENEVRQQKSRAKFAAAADQFQNLVYEQADSLQGVSKALNVPVTTSDLVTRVQAQALAMGSRKFAEAVFSPESVQGKRNTEAIEVGPNALMAGRIVEYKPAAPLALADVKEQIRHELELNAASHAAEKAGQAIVNELQAGKTDKELGITFRAAVKVSRTAPPQEISQNALQAIFRANTSKLPQYVGDSEIDGDYTIYRISNVIPPVTADEAKMKQFGTRITQVLSNDMIDAYVASLKSRADVKINEANLEKK